MHPNTLMYVCVETSTQSAREKLPGQQRCANTSELSCVEWDHFEVLKKPSSFHLHHYQLPCGVSAMATNTRHTLTQTHRHTQAHISHSWSSHTSFCLISQLKKKKKKRQLHKEQRQPCVTAALTSTCLDNTWQENTNATKKIISVRNSQPLGKGVRRQKHLFFFYNFLCLSPTFLQCFSLFRCYYTTVLHHVAMSTSTDCWP